MVGTIGDFESVNSILASEWHLDSELEIELQFTLLLSLLILKTMFRCEIILNNVHVSLFRFIYVKLISHQITPVIIVKYPIKYLSFEDSWKSMLTICRNNYTIVRDYEEQIKNYIPFINFSKHVVFLLRTQSESDCSLLLSVQSEIDVGETQ